MKVPKSIREMPWPEEYHAGQEDLLVTVAQKVEDHERLLVVTFAVNRDKNTYKEKKDFRLICSKKQKRVLVLYKGERVSKKHSLDKAMSEAGTGAWAACCYPYIDERNEILLAKWLGTEASKTANHFMGELHAWSKEAIAAEEKAEKDARGELHDEDVDLCPEELPAGLVDWVRRTVLPRDRVLIYKKGNTSGLCYRCGEQVKSRQGQRFRQGEVTVCPSCENRVFAYLESSDRFKVNYVQNVAAVQRGKDGQTLFIRQWHLQRDPTAQWENIEACLIEVARYAIRGNRVAKWQHEAKENWYMNAYRYCLDGWTRQRDASRIYDGEYEFFEGGIREAAAGTSLQYCDPLEYIEDGVEKKVSMNTIRFLMDWARYPAIEKLWKAGYRDLVHERIRGVCKDRQHAIIWTRKSIAEAIRFPTRLLKSMEPMTWTMDRMQTVADLWQLVEAGSIKESEVSTLVNADVHYKLIGQALHHATAYKVLNYVDKQSKPASGESNQSAKKRAAQAFRDYLEECTLLGLDLSEKSNLFPKNLETAHQRTTGLVRELRDRERTEKQQEEESAQLALFAKIMPKLEKLAWDQEGLLIRPASTPKELRAEGNALNHCVGGYAERMAKGETAIFLIRRKEQPEKPYFTLELSGKRIIQCRTKHNKDYGQVEAVKAFVETWMEEMVKVDGKPKKKRKTSAA